MKPLASFALLFSIATLVACGKGKPAETAGVDSNQTSTKEEKTVSEEQPPKTEKGEKTDKPDADKKPDAPPVASAAPSNPSSPKPLCHAETREGSYDLFLEWDGDSATGTFRKVAQSGEITTLRVQGQKFKGAVVIDDVHADPDLMKHTAIFQDKNGKKQMRVGDVEPRWAPCQ